MGIQSNGVAWCVVLKNRSVISSEKIISNIFSAFQKDFSQEDIYFLAPKSLGKVFRTYFSVFKPRVRISNHFYSEDF